MKHWIIIGVIAWLTAFTGHAANEMVVDGVTYQWSPSDLAYIVTGWDEENPVQSLHIRGEVDGLDVVGIATGAFEDNQDIVFLTIDEGILYIGQNAFCRCSNLEVAILPEGLVKIEEEAFAFCTKLSFMSIPSTVEDIQAHAFSGCTGVTDVYFLMDETRLDDFYWWDGRYPSPGEEQHGGMEFNQSRLDGHNPESGTRIHVPNGMYSAYDESGKFEAWLLEEDDGCYPLWWIVNFGVVGRTYTVSDELTAVYTDVYGGLYAKDENRWLTPDRVYSGEVDYMRLSGLMKELGDVYDQSNWVVLQGVENPEIYNSHQIEGATISGTLIDKKNPVIEVTSSPNRGVHVNFMPNVYIPASFMGRTQFGPVLMKTYAFVQPKPQEYIKVAWAIYHDCDDENEFYVPEPDLDNGINQHGLCGGFLVDYDLYEQPPVPYLVDEGYYEFNAINRRATEPEDLKGSDRPREELSSFPPYVDGGLSTDFTVFPLYLPDEPIPTSIIDVNSGDTHVKEGWYAIDGRFLGFTEPSVTGVYIHHGKKVMVLKTGE